MQNDPRDWRRFEGSPRRRQNLEIATGQDACDIELEDELDEYREQLGARKGIDRDQLRQPK